MKGPRGTGPARVFRILAFLAVASATVLAVQAGTSRFEGKTLSAALQALQASGLKIIYSSELVRPWMRVAGEPRSKAPREILDELLAPHGLVVKEGPRGALLVLKGEARGRISGLVRDALNGSPLPGALVTLADGTGTAVADPGGKFVLADLAPGSYALDVSHPDYLTHASSAVSVSSGKDTEVVVSLTPQNVSAETITVESPGDRLHAPGPDARLTGQEIRESPGAQQDPLMAATRRPGAWSGDGSARMNLRGGSDDEVLVVLDGLELDDPFHLKDDRAMFSIIDARTVSAIDLYEGAFPAAFGGKMSGVMDISSMPPSDGPRVEVGLGSATSHLAGGGSSHDGKMRWMASARAGYPANQLEDMGVDPSYKPKFNDLFGKTEFQLGPSTRLSMHVLAAGDELQGTHGSLIQTVREPGRIRSSYTSRYVWLNLDKAWSPSLGSETILSYGALGQLRTGSRRGLTEVRDERSSSALGLKQTWTFRAGRQAWSWGASTRLVEAGYLYGATAGTTSTGSPATISTQPSGAQMGVHVSDSLRITPWLDTEIGLRWDRETYTGLGGSMLSPRINLVARAGASNVFRVGWGLFYQPQRIDELQVEDGVSRFYPAERSEHLVAGFEHGFKSGMDFRLTAYRKRMTRLRPRYENLLNPFSYFPEARPDRVRLAPDGGLAQGVEVELGGPAGRILHWRAGYALASAVDRIDGQDVPRSWDQRHTAMASLELRPSPRWVVSVAGAYHSGRPWTPLLQGVQPRAGSQLSAGAFQPMNSSRLPSSYRLDLLTSRAWELPQGTLRAYVDVVNLLDHANYAGIGGFNPESEDEHDDWFSPSPRYGAPRTLSFGIAWSY